MRIGLLLLWLLCGASYSPISSGVQRQPPVSLEFEVVSVHATDPKTHEKGTFDLLQDGVTERNNTLTWLIYYAYDLRFDGSVQNQPGWADSERFDLEAKVAPEDISKFQSLSRQQKASMLRRVLEQRFQLRQHTVVKERSVYDLVLAKGSPKLVESKPNADGKYDTLMQAKVGGEFIGKGLTINQMLGNITYFAGRPVIDRTSLDGHYDFDLKWSDPQSPSAGPDDSVGDGPAFFTALTEQLGLKLVPARATFDVVVIDHVERPTPN